LSSTTEKKGIVDKPERKSAKERKGPFLREETWGGRVLPGFEGGKELGFSNRNQPRRGDQLPFTAGERVRVYRGKALGRKSQESQKHIREGGKKRNDRLISQKRIRRRGTPPSYGELIGEIGARTWKRKMMSLSFKSR